MPQENNKKKDALITQEQKQQIVKSIKNTNISDKIFQRVTELEATGGLDLPAGYSAANALKSAWLMIQYDAKLMACTDNSKANALLDMVIQGLSPSKKQCYFIPYGKELQLQRSYLGNVAVTRRLKNVKDVYAQIIYSGDEFEYSINQGIIKIEKHKQKLEDIDNSKIKGAYAIVVRDGDEPVATIMTMAEIEQAWKQGAMKGNSPAHNNFRQEMSKKTVINRACKYFFNTSDDSDLLVESVQRTRDVSDLPEEIYEEVIENQIAEHANSHEIDVKIDEEVEEQKDRFFSKEEEAEILASENKGNGRDF